MMIGKAAALIFESILEEVKPGKGRFISTVKKATSYPVKVLAAFFAAPFLIINVARKVENPIRRKFAVAGVILALLLSYIAGTAIGSLFGLLFIASKFGLLAAFGFLIGTFMSVVFSVVFSYFVFNATCFVFLKFSSEEVAKYLEEQSA